MRIEWVPHLMNLHEPNFRSEVCNTDEFGFRHTIKNSKVLDYAAFQEEPGSKGLVCGGSTAFGVGATNDSATITSALNRSSHTTWFNFAGMAHNSTQELFRFLLFLPKVDQVVLLTGINNLTIHTVSPHFSEVYGAVFSQTIFQLLNNINTNPKYLKYLAGRLRHRFIDSLLQFLPGLTAGTPDMPDFESRYSQSLIILARDLDVWAMLRDQKGFSLQFVLQPIAVWMPKVLSTEEEELIHGLETSGRRQWGAQHEQEVTQTYQRYRQDTQVLCQALNIPWIDCNELLPRDGWLFCDRVHLTDEGQKQAAGVILAATARS